MGVQGFGDFQAGEGFPESSVCISESGSVGYDRDLPGIRNAQCGGFLRSSASSGQAFRVKFTAGPSRVPHGDCSCPA